MFRTILFTFITATACFAAGSQSPEGTWATEIVGHDRGVCYLTFSNDFVAAGYGIAVGAGGPFQMAGTWGLNNRDQLVGALTQFVSGNNAGAKFEGSASQKNLRLRVKSTDGPFGLRGEPASDIADLTGPWTAKAKQNGRPFFVNFDAVLSTNLPAWFDISGSGANQKGSFTMTGAILITPDNRCAAYTTYDYGNSTETDSFVGKLVNKKLVLRGRTDNKQPCSLSAEPDETAP